jgi:hypothetical protein
MMETDSDAVSAHCPGVGVKIYFPDIVLSITDGLQVPVIPFMLVRDRASGVLPEHKGKILSKTGSAGAGPSFTVAETVIPQ